jgi:CRISPR-associated protein Csm1
LGILKADVDNLGRIFIEGIKGHLSISKYVSLSRMMDFFFTGWLQNILSEKYKSVYTVFSGGDDLFLIGPFSQIIDLAQEINHHLKEYVKNEDIHLSCGIYFAKDKIPVYQMAENSETILEEAKYSDKNRIGLFGRVVKWDRFDKIMEDEDFVGFLNNNNVSSGFKYSLFWFSDRAENLVNKKIGFNSKDLKWKALLSYQVYRNVDKDNRGDYLQLLIDRIEKYRGDLRISLSNYLYRNRRRG